MSTRDEIARLAANPVTGELVNFDDATTVELADLVEAARELHRELAYHVDDLVAEVAARLDRTNARTLELEDGRKLETNAPTVDDYQVPDVRGALRPLIDAGILDEEVLGRIVVYPAPSTPPPRIDKRELNKLKAHDNPRIAAALGAVRKRLPQRRTLKINRPEA